jgi:hypothetical protein
MQPTKTQPSKSSTKKSENNGKRILTQHTGLPPRDNGSSSKRNAKQIPRGSRRK